MPAEKKPMGRPKVDTEGLNLRLHRDMIRAIDVCRKEEVDLPSRPEMIRRILSKYLDLLDK